MQAAKFLKTAAILWILVLLIVILVYGKPFLVPLTFAGLLSMLLLPVTKWLQAKGIHPVAAVLLSTLILVAFLALVVFFISWQISDIAENASRLEQQVSLKYQELRQFIAREFGISQAQQQQMIDKQQSASSGKVSSIVTGLISGFGSFLANLLLVFVYIFLFICFRGHIKGFIVRLVPPEHRKNALATIHEARQVAQEYLTGLSLMIVSLWVMYSIGFSIAGVKNAIFFAIICGLLEMVPFVGNLTGTVLTLSMSLVQGGGMGLVAGILITYALVQFIQTYLLEPLVVGAQVSINPMATILALVAGELLWGIPGMILAIPLMGIAKIICDHVPVLEPYAYLVGQEKKEDSPWKKKMKRFGQKVKAWFTGK
ncbi:AI-2E family transporter [Chitinophaga japonensis]|uniref:Putative PurR-regulated permease PerM n=1 Tax=Chitinophaga japonensis TaxID=104662 RepID=A0A562SSM2_CHIJA|nr:AI-2E family transporter [Chitinophaga japonensis]TWI84245.1 putative PurR-regulated permease PerM [Chitinophaga japonensis]